MNRFVHATYPNEAYAQRAVEWLVDEHFPPEDISVVLHGAQSDLEVPVVHQTPIGRDAAVGAALGMFIGGALGVTGVVGGLLDAGPALAALEAGVAGGALGTLAGALMGLGSWKSGVELPSEKTRNSGIQVVVATLPARVDAARSTLAHTGGERVSVTDRKPIDGADAPRGAA